jgi:spore germination protein GerM
MTTVTIHLIRDGRVEAVPRRVPRVPRIGTAALEQLLDGPTPQEAADGYGTAIPADTRLRDLAITDGVAVVDLSREFESAGDTRDLTLRLAQVTCTLTVFPTVDGVRFAIDGAIGDVFAGDGTLVEDPVGCRDYAEVVAAGS